MFGRKCKPKNYFYSPKWFKLNLFDGRKGEWKEYRLLLDGDAFEALNAFTDYDSHLESIIQINSPLE